MSKVVGLDGKAASTEVAPEQLEIVALLDNIRKAVIDNKGSWCMMIYGDDEGRYRTRWILKDDMDVNHKIGVLESLKYDLLRGPDADT